MLVAGVVTNEALSFEKYCELLLFPGEASIAQSIKEFRAEIKQHIAATHPAGKKIESTLQFLSEKEHSFTRDQVVSLLVALGGEDEKHFGMMGFWFKNLKPEPDNVLRLLIARNNLDPSDYFNGEAAGYISAVRFSPSRLELRALATHKVSLARAFAYARLDTSIPEELDLLNKALAIEPDDDLRRDLQRKIALAKEMGR
jgi:hypothetical protein